jgi:hypothetical protein
MAFEVGSGLDGRCGASKRRSTCVIARHGDDRRASQAPTNNEVDVSRRLEQDGCVSLMEVLPTLQGERASRPGR